MEAWQTDWSEFCALLARLRDSGWDNARISSHLKDKPVAWKGVVLSPGDDDSIQVDMPEQLIPLKGKRELKTFHIVAKYDEPERTKWMRLSEGDEISFTAEINGATGVFPGIRLVDFGVGSDRAADVGASEQVGEEEVVSARFARAR